MNFENLKSFMNDLTEWRIPGNSVVVYKDNEKVFEYSSGFSDVENKIKMNGSELVNVYSCSKPITVTAAMQLYEKGKFLLSDPLYEFIPEFKEMYVCTNGGEIEENHKWVIQEEITEAKDQTEVLEPGTEVTLEAKHMEGMEGATATIDSAEDTTVYMIDYEPTDGGETVRNHKWFVGEEFSPVENQ